MMQMMETDDASKTFDASKSFKSRILVKEQAGVKPIKMLVNKYSDSILFILTQRNKFGTFIQVTRGPEGLDVNRLNGSSKRSEKYLEIVRTFMEIWTANPRQILDISDEALIKKLENLMLKKKIYFNVCLDFSKIDNEGEVSEGDEEVLVELYKQWKEFIKENFEFFF